MNRIKQWLVQRKINKASEDSYSSKWHRYQLFLLLRQYFVVEDRQTGEKWDDLSELELFEKYHNRDHQQMWLIEPKSDYIAGRWHWGVEGTDYIIEKSDWESKIAAYSTTHDPDIVGFTFPKHSMTDWICGLDRRSEVNGEYHELYFIAT